MSLLKGLTLACLIAGFLFIFLISITTRDILFTYLAKAGVFLVIFYAIVGPRWSDKE